MFIGALFSLILIAPTAATAATPEPTALTPELATLATPAVAAEPPAAQAEAIGLPTEGPGSLAREGERVIVEARLEAGAPARLEALESAGADILVASRQYETVALSIEPEDLQALAEVPGVSAVAPSRRPVYYGTAEVFGTAAIRSNGLCEGGSVISQGLEQLNVPAARAAFGARGAGETIGVISDSFGSATTSIEGGPIATTVHGDEVSNDLPGRVSTCSGQQVPVDVIAEAPPPAAGEEAPTDEGRAMLQVVHDLAPHSQLAFATAEPSELAFARNIERLAAPVAAGGAGANVIVDDVSYLTEPFFQDGPVAVAIEKVTKAGVTYLTAAGNENLFEVGTGNEIGSWEAPEYRAISCPAGLGVLGSKIPQSCMNFAASGPPDSRFGISVVAGGTATIDLQWAEPWFGVETDLNAYLLNSSNQIVSQWQLGEGALDSVHAGVPIELLEWKNTDSEAESVFLVIGRCSGACNSSAHKGTPRLKFEFVGHGRGVNGIEYRKSEGGNVVGPTIYGHAGSADAITLGAIRYTESASAPREPEYYSSRGPATHYFGPVASATPAAPLSTPEKVQKPNLTATDCASTTFFAQFEAGGWHFCGTSEAAPHAAAVAALMKQTDPFASPAAILAAMEASATHYTPVSQLTKREAVGAGLLNAAAAITAVGGSPVNDPPSFVVPALEGEETPPVPSPPTPEVKITKGPKALGNQKRPTFEFTSSVSASFSCQMSGGAAQSCSSPYTVPSALGDGRHSFSVTATAQGRSGSSAYAFKVDTKAPKVKIAGHPKKVIKTRKRSVVARFKLKASGGPATFYCQVDREARRACGKKFRHRFKRGKHELKVWATDAAGNSSAKPAVLGFQVKGLRRSRSPR